MFLIVIESIVLHFGLFQVCVVHYLARPVYFVKYAHLSVLCFFLAAFKCRLYTFPYTITFYYIYLQIIYVYTFIGACLNCIYLEGADTVFDLSFINTLFPLLGLVSGMNYLKEVDLSRCSKVTDSGIKHLLSIQTIEKLWLSETSVTSDGVTLLSSLKRLSTLDLGGLFVSDKALASLQVFFFLLITLCL